jgi:hypothetical protein
MKPSKPVQFAANLPVPVFVGVMDHSERDDGLEPVQCLLRMGISPGFSRNPRSVRPLALAAP